MFKKGFFKKYGSAFAVLLAAFVFLCGMLLFLNCKGNKHKHHEPSVVNQAVRDCVNDLLQYEPNVNVAMVEEPFSVKGNVAFGEASVQEFSQLAYMSADYEMFFGWDDSYSAHIILYDRENVDLFEIKYHCTESKLTFWCPDISSEVFFIDFNDFDNSYDSSGFNMALKLAGMDMKEDLLNILEVLKIPLAFYECPMPSNYMISNELINTILQDIISLLGKYVNEGLCEDMLSVKSVESGDLVNIYNVELNENYIAPFLVDMAFDYVCNDYGSMTHLKGFVGKNFYHDLTPYLDFAKALSSAERNQLKRDLAQFIPTLQYNMNISVNNKDNSLARASLECNNLFIELDTLESEDDSTEDKTYELKFNGIVATKWVFFEKSPTKGHISYGDFNVTWLGNIDIEKSFIDMELNNVSVVYKGNNIILQNLSAKLKGQSSSPIELEEGSDLMKISAFKVAPLLLKANKLMSKLSEAFK